MDAVGAILKEKGFSNQINSPTSGSQIRRQRFHDGGCEYRQVKRGNFMILNWTTLSSFRLKERNVERGYLIEFPQAVCLVTSSPPVGDTGGRLLNNDKMQGG
jgi:hypothetical protein